MLYETEHYTFELPEKWRRLVAVSGRSLRVAIRETAEEDPAHSGVLCVLKLLKRDRPSGTAEYEDLGLIVFPNGERRHLFAVYGEEGACGEDTADLYFRLCDGLFPVFESIRPREGHAYYRADGLPPGGR